MDEPTNIPRSKKACASCGQEFEFLDGVSVSKCPECKLKDIEGTHSVEKVSIHYKQELGASLPAAKAGAKSPGKDYGNKASSKLKPVSSPPVVPLGGKKGDSGGGGGGGSSEEPHKPGKGEVHDPNALTPETPEEEEAAQRAIAQERGGGWEDQPRGENGQWK
jgi:predicted RNA-binding Zn-ribbon protein involved in translation (DUF1610 family)